MKGVEMPAHVASLVGDDWKHRILSRTECERFDETLRALVAAKSAPTMHRQDSDCDVGDDGQCRGCGVSHTMTCLECEGRGFHKPECPDNDERCTEVL